MLMRLITIVLIVIAILSSASCMFNKNDSCDNFLETTSGKLAIIVLAILAASQHLICGLVVALLFVMVTNVHRDGFTDTDEPKKEHVKLDTNMLLEQPAIKLAFRDKVCNRKAFTAHSAENKKLVSEMTNKMTMTFPHGPCNPCSDAETECNFEITDGYDQLHAEPKSTSARVEQ